MSGLGEMPSIYAKRACGAVLAAVLAASFAGAARAETPIPPSATDFAKSAIQSDQYEIQAATVAVAQTHNPRLRQFAEEMIAAHTRTTEDMRQAISASGLMQPPPAMSTDQAAMLSALQSLRGADFDKAYLSQQILAHQQALTVEQSYADAGNNGPLRQAARSAIPVIQRHLDMARQMNGAPSAVKPNAP